MVVMGGVIVTTHAASLPTITPTAQLSTSPTPSLHRRVQRDLANRLNVPPSSLQVVETTSATWPDQCLGLAQPNQRCQGGEVSGWRIQVASAQQMWTYRSDRTGQQLKLEPLTPTLELGTGDFSAETSRRLLQTVAQQVNVPRNRLRVLEVQSATWDGCLGIYEPDQACTMIALPGFRTLIADGETTWVYHLDETGEQIAQNSVASGAQTPLLVSFMPTENSPEILDSQIVFQSQIMGDFTGSVQRTVLMADGKLYREQTMPMNNTEPTRELIKTLSVEEVEAFRNQLAQQGFANFNHLRYLTEEAFADYPTVRLQMPYLNVEYIDLAIDQLPPNLQEIITLWDALSQPT